MKDIINLVNIMKRGENMGILIRRMPNFNRMKETSDWLDKHPEETQKLINQLETENISDEELDKLNNCGGSIDYGGRIIVREESE